MFTMGQAAIEAGVSKATLSRAIKSGKVSAKKNVNGGWDIDPAELFRVYPPRNTSNGSSNPSMKQTVTPAVMASETATLQAQIDGLKAQVDLMRESLDDLKGQREGWQKQAEASQRLLADNRQSRGWFRLGKVG